MGSDAELDKMASPYDLHQQRTAIDAEIDKKAAEIGKKDARLDKKASARTSIWRRCDLGGDQAREGNGATGGGCLGRS
eukprot:NODE_8568_length_377_cov_82.847826.p4 GENE.NODE_8568_length_377_cov_82.847826~~NODE_8568_length_377_cov_82.847826.p4  ORF type:complete len:78 (+),score=24.14 NODE_8568_length_377_cov_82.847826:3-236(+)